MAVVEDENIYTEEGWHALSTIKFIYVYSIF